MKKYVLKAGEKGGTIHPVIDRVFPFDQAKAAYAYLKRAGHFGKIVIHLES